MVSRLESASRQASNKEDRNRHRWFNVPSRGAAGRIRSRVCVSTLWRGDRGARLARAQLPPGRPGRIAVTSRLDAVVEVHHAVAESAFVQQLEMESDIPGWGPLP